MTTQEDTQRGLDMARYYQDLLDHPPALVPYNPFPLQELIKRCRKGVSPQDAFVIGSLAGPLSSKGWEMVESNKFNFPHDNGPHYNIRKEWWSLSCNLDVPNQIDPISLLFVIVRRGTIPAYMRRTGQSGKDSQVVFSQAYVTIPQKKTHYSSRHYFNGKDTIMNSKPFNISASSNLYMRSDYDDSVFPMNIAIRDTDSKMDIKLALSTTNNPNWFPQGSNGCAPCISGMGYRYYSWPIISVQGTIKVDTISYSDIKGVGWLDHQWGARMNPLGYFSSYYLRGFNNISAMFNTPKLNIRWNWFFFHLDDNTEITTALLPAPEPNENNKGPFNLTHTAILDIGNKKLIKKNISGSLIYQKFGISHTGTLYPLEWQIHFPTENMYLIITPTIPNQFGNSDDNSEFLEAGVLVSGTRNGKRVTGTGFAECIAYQSDHDFINTSLLELGYSVDDVKNIVSEFYPVKPGGGLFVLSLFIVLLPIFLITLIIFFSVMIIQMNMKK